MKKENHKKKLILEKQKNKKYFCCFAILTFVISFLSFSSETAKTNRCFVLKMNFYTFSRTVTDIDRCHKAIGVSDGVGT